jgi:hypothetical protein
VQNTDAIDNALIAIAIGIAPPPCLPATNSWTYSRTTVVPHFSC